MARKVADFIYDKTKKSLWRLTEISIIYIALPKGNAKAIGICHYEEMSEGDYREIFICPTRTGAPIGQRVDSADCSPRGYTCCFLRYGHGPKFKKIIMDYLGATGIPTATVSGPQFTALFKTLSKS